MGGGGGGILACGAPPRPPVDKRCNLLGPIICQCVDVGTGWWLRLPTVTWAACALGINLVACGLGWR